MTSIESKTVQVSTGAGKLFDYLSNFNNFQHLMPPQVTRWQSTDDSCSFNIQGMADIELKIVEKTPGESIRIAASGNTPIPLFMTWKFVPLQETLSEARLLLDAELNPVMAMMAKAPLQNFVNLLVDKLREMSEDGSI